MKRILSLGLVAAMLLSVLVLSGCSAKENLKFGMGVYSYVSAAKDADGDTNGEGEVVETAAVVLLDKNNKIVKCEIDTADNKLGFTSEGKYVVASEFKTKYELGYDYNMKKYGQNVAKEWFEQVDAFEGVVIGKTIDEVKALIADKGYGTSDVMTAGCTIAISDFVYALEKAVANAKDSTATEDSNINLGIVTVQADSKDASDETDGVNEITTTFVATALDKDGKIVAAVTDAVQMKFKFDKNGAAITDKTANVKTKNELGNDYNMAKYGASFDLNGDGVVKEWFEQADAFSKTLIGKTAADIPSLAIDTGYGNETLQTAGCTIAVSDMVKAAAKAAVAK